jgi:hypothetical protein
METFDAPAVLFEGGRLVLSDNVIESRGPGVRVGDGARSGILRGNLIDAHGNPAIIRGSASVLVDGNVERQPTPRPR